MVLPLVRVFSMPRRLCAECVSWLRCAISIMLLGCILPRSCLSRAWLCPVFEVALWNIQFVFVVPRSLIRGVSVRSLASICVQFRMWGRGAAVGLLLVWDTCIDQVVDLFRLSWLRANYDPGLDGG